MGSSTELISVLFSEALYATNHFWGNTSTLKAEKPTSHLPSVIKKYYQHLSPKPQETKLSKGACVQKVF